MGPDAASFRLPVGGTHDDAEAEFLEDGGGEAGHPSNRLFSLTIEPITKKSTETTATSPADFVFSNPKELARSEATIGTPAKNRPTQIALAC
ncbi:MAG: hypothetical protein O9293_04520 [Porphyrobacter sp.]|nr:hypothetical protein [Porphyrobacter sp.]